MNHNILLSWIHLYNRHNSTYIIVSILVDLSRVDSKDKTYTCSYPTDYLMTTSLLLQITSWFYPLPTSLLSDIFFHSSCTSCLLYCSTYSQHMVGTKNKKSNKCNFSGYFEIFWVQFRTRNMLIISLHKVEWLQT